MVRSNEDKVEIMIMLYGEARRNLHETVRLFNAAYPDRPVDKASISSTLSEVKNLVTYAKAETGLGYYDMPYSVKEATQGGKWVKLEEYKSMNVDVYAQPEDPRVMLLFDKKGTIAGIRMAFLKEDIEKKATAGGYKFGFDYDKNAMYEKGNYFGKDLWYAEVLFASPKTLAAGGRNTPNKLTQDVAEGIYFKADGQWKEVSRDECKQTDGFREANCFAGMGKHYFYKMDLEDCNQRTSIFVLYDEGRLSGFGLAGFGSFGKNPKTQSYFEDFPPGATKAITPNAPACVADYITKYGLTTMHVFFKKNAAQLTCPAQDWRIKNC